METAVKTYSPKAAELYKDWHVLDAAGQPLGRIASQAAHLLRGKHKPGFAPHLDCGDCVIIVNAEKIVLTGSKADQKVYYRHSQYPGGLKTESFRSLQGRDATRVVRKAVRGMLPHNRLGDRVIKHLKTYTGPDHPHVAQVVGAERARAKREEAQKAAADALRAHVEPAMAGAVAEKPRRARRATPEPAAVTAPAAEAAAVAGSDAQPEDSEAKAKPPEAVVAEAATDTKEAEAAVAVAEAETAPPAGEEKAPARRTRRKVQKESDE
jgi:large subunit ribosomal protein L13